jgi:kumamolisin
MACVLTVSSSGLKGASAPDGARIHLNDSIVGVPVAGAATQAHVVRTALTAEELAAPVDFVVSLRMRNFPELEARIQRGETIPKTEMESRYLPLAADYERMASWLRAQGAMSTLADKNHTNLFARGSVSTLSRAFEVTFARVATADGEFTSAVTAPSLPGAFSGTVLGVGGLQPHIRMHTQALQESEGTEAAGDVTPADILYAYDGSVGNDTKGNPIVGSGQTIAIIMDAVPLETDLTAFWQAADINDSLSNYSLVNVSGGPSSAGQTTDDGEVTLDVEWASGIAPGAALRLYAVPSLNGMYLLAACTQILNEGLATIVSQSAGSLEVTDSAAGLQAGTQATAQLVAAGITMLASSGDGGSNPNPVGQPEGYTASNPLSVEYPASDPNVTGVGGTLMSFDINWNPAGETAWSQFSRVSTNPGATGGGISSYFSRPYWQVGTGVPSGTMRCVPDVAAMAETSPSAAGSYTGGFIVLNGKQTGLVGTSLACPIWAGVVALTNQYRVSAGLPNLGLLNRWVYALIGSNAVFDITTGTNGAYAAGTGYDLCTGIGSPDIAQFINQTTREIFYVTAPTSPVSPGTSVTMSVTPQFNPSTYQWLLNGTSIAGATGSTYNIPSASTADAGTYTVVITNALIGSTIYNLGTLTVSPLISNSTRLINISTRAQVGTGGNILIPGFVVSGGGMETLLIRADGPSLTQFGVAGVLAQPSLSVYNNSGVVIATNTGWGTNANSAQIASVATAVGAFALPSGSADCAIIVALPAGAYTVQVSGVGNTTGVALAEVYEVSSTGTRLANVSTRTQVGTGGNILIPGFVIGGSGTEELLVRADGPSLTQFGVAGVLAQPTLSVLSGQAVLGSNTGWGTAPDRSQIASVGTSVGAFSLASGSSDSAMIVKLMPGAYTAQISGENNTTGVALAEIYEVP